LDGLVELMMWCCLAGLIIGLVLGALAKLRNVTGAMIGVALSTVVVFALMLSLLTWSSVPQPVDISFYLSLFSIPFSLLGISGVAMFRRPRGN